MEIIEKEQRTEKIETLRKIHIGPTGDPTYSWCGEEYQSREENVIWSALRKTLF
jgi:hypothetical protein